MLVTLYGITILVRELAPEKAKPPMLVNWLYSSNITLVRVLALLKALSPMLVTLFGIVILVRALAP